MIKKKKTRALENGEISHEGSDAQFLSEIKASFWESLLYADEAPTPQFSTDGHPWLHPPSLRLARHQGGQVCSSLRVKTACAVTGVRAVGLPSWGSHESGNYAQKGVTKGWILTVFAVYFYAYR